MRGVFHENDTIAQLITGADISAVSVIRISGAAAVTVLKKIFKGHIDYKNIKTHTIHYGHIVDAFGNIVDEVLVSIMLSPRSYTTEDVVEINCHGGVKVTGDCLRLVFLNGARPAEPGEFTKRAFMNGRIDLSQAEAVSDLIYASTEQARRASLRQLGGGLKNAVDGLRDGILGLMARIEAALDFPDDITDALTPDAIKERAAALLDGVNGLIGTADYGKIAMYGLETVIVGRPNVGKSSLYNAMLGGDRAIVTDIPGTTRDVLQEYINIGGLSLKITDTAGLRHTTDELEKLGAAKTREFLDRAELALPVVDGSQPLTDGDMEIINGLSGKKAVVVVNKADKPSVLTRETLEALTGCPVVFVSAKNKTGLDKLYDEIKKMFLSSDDIRCEDAVYKERHINCLYGAADALGNVMKSLEAGLPEDFLSIDLADAYTALGGITGDTLEDDLIDRIFQEFCIGK